jgi:hypothetical protein
VRAGPPLLLSAFAPRNFSALREGPALLGYATGGLRSDRFVNFLGLDEATPLKVVESEGALRQVLDRPFCDPTLDRCLVLIISRLTIHILSQTMSTCT